ncbi:hypothetical protein ACGFNU_48035 [Spirillospora sp. NPDC048911]|uniref:hypothetical protein n=1 Tax=Spirillospora sp. NPDC048911 TaxID=3364527 RepID=UPI0037204BAC
MSSVPGRENMTRLGIMVHCRNLATEAWEELVFGRPEHNQLGDHATLARVVLCLESSEELACVVFGRGTSWRDGLNEGDYSKKFLLDNLDRLREFPALAPLLARRDGGGLAAFRRSMEAVIVTAEVRNTVEEIEAASAIFARHGVEKVIQIAAASHAARCVKELTAARARGRIGADRLWFTVATDMAYHGTGPEDVVVLEPLHRRDQPMTSVRPGLAEAIAPYFRLPDEDKKEFIALVEEFMTRPAGRRDRDPLGVPGRPCPRGAGGACAGGGHPFERGSRAVEHAGSTATSETPAVPASPQGECVRCAPPGITPPGDDPDGPG